jgi:aspartyl-tRNA(Asn)/glutamyl-tRNA(Gln) amidotransferase subunit C
MPIDKKLISKLEKLAMLNLSNEEREEVQKDLNEILTMINKLEEFDTKETKPLVYLTGSKNVVREDQVGNHLNKKDGLINAKAKDDKFFIVPKVIK